MKITRRQILAACAIIEAGLVFLDLYLIAQSRRGMGLL